MPVHLPLVAKHEGEHTYCAYCPKLCRFSCPVSTVEGRETTTPWGKMSSLHHVVTEALPLDPAYAATWYACTGCKRCTEFCAHDNQVADTLIDARSEAVRHGVAPGEALEVIAKHQSRERNAALRADAIFADSMSDLSQTIAYVPGCTTVMQSGDAALHGLEVTRALTTASTRVEASACCGLPLLEAGDHDGFVRAAQAFLTRVSKQDVAVFQDPGCLHALRVTAKTHGVESRTTLLHITELAASRLQRFHERKTDGPVRYHDPCRLGRGLGVFDEPRRVLQQILGRPPDEFVEYRAHSECSGAGGQLPRLYKQTSKDIAKERMGQHARHGGGTVVTACPAAANAFRKNGDAIVLDIVTLMRDSLL